MGSVQHPCLIECPKATEPIGKTRLTLATPLLYFQVAGCATGCTPPKGVQVGGVLQGLYPLFLATYSIRPHTEARNLRLDVVCWLRRSFWRHWWIAVVWDTYDGCCYDDKERHHDEHRYGSGSRPAAFIQCY